MKRFALMTHAPAALLCLLVTALGAPTQRAAAVGENERQNRTDTQTQDAASFARVFQHRAAEVNSIRLHYVTGGSGPPVVLLHGNLKTWYAWRKVMPALSNRYTVIVPDLRGVGASSRPATGYDKRTVAEDVYQLMRRLGHDSFYLVGHDVGGWVAYALAANHREAVRRLVIVDVPLPGIGLEATMDVARGGSWHFGFGMLNDLNETLVAGHERAYVQWFARNNTFVPDAISEEDLDEYTRAYTTPGAMRAAFSYYRTLPEDARQNRASAKTKLRIPTLAVGAANAGRERTLQDLQVVAEQVRSVLIAECGHYVPEERPAELAAAITMFFAEP